MNPITYILHAMAVAEEAHRGQTRKYTGTPYIEHPLAVASLVSLATNDPDIIAAALLHDVVEDTNVSFLSLASLGFNKRTVNMVDELTDCYTPREFPGVPRDVRKAKEAARIATISPDAATIKLADLISNTMDIVKHDADFAVVYLKEKQAVLAGLTQGNMMLYQEAEDWLKHGILELTAMGKWKA